MDLKSAIHPGALDLLFNSATNATQKGQSQYSTPIELATVLAQELADHRPVIVDLTSGPGNLLLGCANHRTEHLLGMDVDPRGLPKSNGSCRKNGPCCKHHFIHADLTAMYEPMCQIDFRADCFVLNPPWSLNWVTERLQTLSDSAVPAVAKVATPQVKKGGTMDSTLATLMIALDRLSDIGEGLLIGYTSTLDRLLFAREAIGAPLARHIWKCVAVKDIAPPGCPLHPGIENASVIYFSRSHETGPTANGRRPPFMARVNTWNCRRDTMEQWQALTEQARATLPTSAPKYHLSLSGSGQIRVRQGLFDTALAKVNGELAKTAKRLYDLDGRNPMQVVMQRAERTFVFGLCRGDATAQGSMRAAAGCWTVEPALREAVQKAVNEYNAIRAPLVPLPKIQRLGYLDEQDSILCILDLETPGKCFRAGARYPLATRSMRFTRTQFKPNLHGEEEELELSGQELAIIVGDENTAATFMDGALRNENVRVGDAAGADLIDFTLQQLVDHFEIPDVPDIASANPERFQSFVSQLHQLEQWTG
jgi:hypothetical protein